MTYYKGRVVRVTALRDITEYKQAEALNDIQRELALQLSAVVGLDAVLHICLNSAVQNTETDSGAIYLVSNTSGDLNLACSMGFSPEYVKVAAKFKAHSPDIEIIMRGQTVFRRYADLDFPKDDFRILENLVMGAALPIRFEGQIIAFLNVASHTLERIPESEKRILEAIAAQIGSAVARAQAEEQLRLRADQLHLINDIGEKIAAVLDLESVLSRTARLIQEDFNYEHVSLFLVDRPQNQVVMKTLSGDFVTLFNPDHTLALGEGIVGTAALKNETTVANDVDTFPDYVNYYPDIIHTRSELSVPIQIGGQVQGVIDAQSIKPNAFDENDIMVMETLADQVAVAIHNANLHEAVQRELAERKRIQSALAEAHAETQRNLAFTEALLSAIPTPVFFNDAQGYYIGCNQAFAAQIGLTSEQIRGKTVYDLWPSEHAEIFNQKDQELINNPKQQVFEFVIRDKDGEDRNVIFAKDVFYNESGEVAGLVGAYLDITERKRFEQALQNSEQTLSSIFRAAPTGIGLVSERQIIQINKTICEMLGYAQEELTGQNARILYPTDEDYEYVGREKYNQIYEFGTGTVETRWQRKNGQIIDVLMSSTPIDPEDLTRGVTFTALDITERKLAESRIQRQVQRLEALNKIDAAITGNLTLEHTIDILLEHTVRQLDVDAAAILLYQPPTQTLEYYAVHGFSLSNPLPAIRLGETLAGRVALERRTINASTADDLFQTYDQIWPGQDFQSYFGVPLITKGQVKGVLEIYDRSVLTPQEGWLSFLETLAGQAAIAIDTTELVENLERSNLELRLAYNNTLEGWARALELRDFETRGHSQRVTELTAQVARAVGIPEDELVHVLRGALLHDIGKMGISDQILLKNGPLDEDEWAIMRQHPVYAHEMLSSITFLRPALDIPHYHHEKWDGSGYPYGLKGEAIPLAARVFAIIDVWDALSSERPYRAAWPKDEIIDLIRAETGKHFDPRVVDAFLEIITSKSSDSADGRFD